jgi:Ca2+:H+ antiporter
LIGKEGVEANLKEKIVQSDKAREESEVGWSRNQVLGILAAVAVSLAFMSEVLTGAIEPAVHSLSRTPKVVGIFLLALVVNAAELFNAVRFACKDQMDLAIGISVGASAQVVLLVAPVLVFLSMIMGHDMDLIFSPGDLIAIVMSVYAARSLSDNGESSWLEGLVLIGVCFLFGIAFMIQPRTDPPHPLILPPAAVGRP